MLTQTVGGVEHTYHCPWLSKFKLSDSTRASHSPQPELFSGTSNKLISCVRLANCITVRPTQEISMFGHMGIHQ